MEVERSIGAMNVAIAIETNVFNFWRLQAAIVKHNNYLRPCGLMEKASVSGAGDCRFESCHGR